LIDWTRQIRTVDDVRAFFAELIAEGINFHPDDEFKDYVRYGTDERLFTDGEADQLDKMMQLAFQVCSTMENDIYRLALDAFHKGGCLTVPGSTETPASEPAMFALACVTQDQNGTSVEVFIGPTEDEVWLRASRDLYALIQQRNETGDRGAMQDAEAAFHTMTAKEFVEMWNGNSNINSLPNVRYVPTPIYLADIEALPAWDGQFVTARIQVSEAIKANEVRAFLEAMSTVCAEDCPAGWEVFSVTTGVA
jgi:hypothetical protein